MAKKGIVIIFIALVIFSAIYALWDRRDVTTSSDNAYQAYEAGLETMQKLYYHEALPYFEQAISIDTNFASAYGYLGALYFDLDRKEEAKQMLAKAVSLFPLITERERMLITITQANVNEDVPAAEKAIDEYINKYPDDIHALRFIANRYNLNKDYANAITYYEKIIDKDPGDALAYNMLGYLNYYNRDFDKAIENIKKYSIIASREANPRDSYGEILMYIGRYDEAIKEFKAADKIKPDLDFVLSHLGMVYRELGRYRDAIGYFERAKEFARNEGYAARAEEQIAFTLFLSGDKANALKSITNLHAEHPEWYSIVTYWGIIAAGNGELDISYAAIDELDKLLEKADSLGQNQNYKDEIIISREILRGRIYSAEKNYEKAIGAFSQCVEMGSLPGLLMYRFLLGKAYFDSGKLEQAEKILLTDLDDNPNNPFALFTLSQVYKEMGNTELQRQILLKYLSVMSGADDTAEDVRTARQQLDSLTEL